MLTKAFVMIVTVLNLKTGGVDTIELQTRFASMAACKAQATVINARDNHVATCVEGLR